MLVRDDLLQIRGPGYCFYVLRAEEGLYLLDSGFIGARWLLRRALKRSGWARLPICGVIITHGHLDHVLHAARLAREHSAWIAAPWADAEHYRGAYPYRGAARVCGALEAAGRWLFRYEPFAVDRWLEDGDFLTEWHGLEVIHLPGHTVGHSGFYCRKLRLLFCGDLFATQGIGPHLPPFFLNSRPELIPHSVEKALQLDLAGVLPNHCDRSPPEIQLQRLQKLAADVRRKTRQE